MAVTRKSTKSATRKSSKAKPSTADRKAAYDAVMRQLMVFHNPFSAATSNPKIPDGKMHKSLGFSTQAVEEFTHSDDTMHFLLFAGMNACLMTTGSDKDGLLGSRTWYSIPFTGSNGLDYSTVNLGTLDSGNALQNRIRQDGDYAFWRAVSVGMQLKQLNTVEEDDGWWEAVRITEPLDSSYWGLGTTGNDSSQEGELACSLPNRMIQNYLNQRNLVNDPTYMTGLTRDLKDLQFELHNVKAEHDFIHLKESIQFSSDEVSTTSDTEKELTWKGGQDAGFDTINNFADLNLDMIYLRLHQDGSTPANRFHVNCVMNQELVYQVSTRDSRYHNTTPVAGPNDIHRHLIKRRSRTASAAPRNYN